MTSRFSMIVASVVLGAACHAEEAPKDDAALKSALAQQWDSLTVCMTSFCGCTEPTSEGLRITRTKTGLSMAKWEDRGSGEKVGPSKEFAAALLPNFIDGVLKHYAEARASDDFHEELAKMKDERERKAAMEKRAKAAEAAQMLGGFAWAGIDIRVSMGGAQTSFDDRYGNLEIDHLRGWLILQTR